MRRFQCSCGNTIYFESWTCLKCGSGVGFDPKSGTMRHPDGMQRCANGLRHGVCNWLVPRDSPEELCASCRLNRTIPDLTLQRNTQLWERTETVKRRLLYALLNLGITLPTLAEDPQQGLAFDIVSINLNPALTTGHLRGVITINIEEADDTYRQINRQQLGEASRTLLGHFRHESGHYLWHRALSPLPPSHPMRQAFREIFGDETQDYASALSRHYQYGPPANWQETCISAYATSHPWEDWAETWAHYLQIIDGFETCEHLGVRGGGIDLPLVRLPANACTLPATLVPPDENADRAFLGWLQRWICLAVVVNEISRSFGAPFLYPYYISNSVARKLRFAHHFTSQWQARPSL